MYPPIWDAGLITLATCIASPTQLARNPYVWAMGVGALLMQLPLGAAFQYGPFAGLLMQIDAMRYPICLLVLGVLLAQGRIWRNEGIVWGAVLAKYGLFPLVLTLSVAGPSLSANLALPAPVSYAMLSTLPLPLAFALHFGTPYATTLRIFLASVGLSVLLSLLLIFVA